MKLSTILGSAAVFLAEADHVTAQHWFSSCSGTFFIVEQRWMVAQCQTTYNTMRWSKLDLNPCISNFNGNLFKTNGVVPGG
ncbi:hypothetical protein QC762_0044170 [Podospora pseudocomata]|uniref:Cyanovirin-N domain-containing protein n=1 Tax=Podospora pseudocomata TaxID=2093779 RepID=A0ABR0GND5_9PEZI|nr:hypothetical protein QC762_0044170 [Podospora pseudocomata]